MIEYNCRFGDPETQVVLPLLKTDLLTVMRAVTAGKLRDVDVRFSPLHTACVIMASQGYPVSYRKGFEIDVPEAAWPQVYIAGAKAEDEKLLTSGGRVLGVTAVAPTLRKAVEDAYRTVKTIHFDNAYYRRDIGARALAAGES